MESKLLETNIFNSVEKILRQIIPGVAFCIMFAIFYPKSFSIVCKILPDSQLIKFLVILTIGMTIYALHTLIVIRFYFEPKVYKLNKSPVNVISGNTKMSDYSKAHATLIIDRQRWKDYPKEYSYYLWAGVHYSFMMAELSIFFAIFHEEYTWKELLRDSTIFKGPLASIYWVIGSIKPQLDIRSLGEFVDPIFVFLLFGAVIIWKFARCSYFWLQKLEKDMTNTFKEEDSDKIKYCTIKYISAKNLTEAQFIKCEKQLGSPD